MTDMIDRTTVADDTAVDVDIVTDAPTSPALSAQLNAVSVKAAVAYRSKVRATEASRAATAAVVATYGLKATQQAVDPLGSGRVISQVTVSKPSFTASFSDWREAEAWVREHYPEKVEKKTRVIPGQEQAALLALQANAAYLLEEHEYIPDYVLDRLLSNSEQAHEPMGLGCEIGGDAPPGIQVDQRPATVKITYRDEDLIDDLIEQGVIDDEGNILVKPAAAPAPVSPVVASTPSVDLAVDFVPPAESLAEIASDDSATAGRAA